jgi:hypothetical protein
MFRLLVSLSYSRLFAKDWLPMTVNLGGTKVAGGCSIIIVIINAIFQIIIGFKHTDGKKAID